MKKITLRAFGAAALSPGTPPSYMPGSASSFRPKEPGIPVMAQRRKFLQRNNFGGYPGVQETCRAPRCHARH